jgi:restriction system protein
MPGESVEGDHLHGFERLRRRTAYAAGVSPRVILVDGERVAELMIDHNVGVSNRETYAVKRVDSDYFGEEE